jgi:hypothetical protein
MQMFNAKAPGEAVVLSFNFTLFCLPQGIFLTGTPVLTFATELGTDPDPLALINGPPAVDITGYLVQQPVIGGLDATSYLITATCLTTNGYWTPVMPALLPVKDLAF